MRVSTVQGGRRVDNPKWEWVDTIFGMMTGVFSAIGIMTGWTSRKFTVLHERHDKLRNDMDGKVDELHARVTPLAESVAGLEAHHEGFRDRLKAIDEKLGRIENHLMNGRG